VAIAYFLGSCLPKKDVLRSLKWEEEEVREWTGLQVRLVGGKREEGLRLGSWRNKGRSTGPLSE